MAFADPAADHFAETPPGAAAPLNESQRRDLTAGRERARWVRRAASVAGFNGWTIGVLAALSAPFALFSLSGAVLTAGMAAVAYVEFRGRRGLRRFDPSAATLLGYNQLGLLALISGYCVWAMASGLGEASSLPAQLAARPELRDVLGPTDTLEATLRVAVVAFYGVVILLSVVFQGGNAWYYFTRRRVVEEYLRETPDWVVDLQRLTGAG